MKASLKELLLIINQNPSVNPRKKSIDIIDKLNTLDLVSERYGLSLSEIALLRQNILSTKMDQKMFSIRFWDGLKEEISQYIPTLYHSRGEFCRIATWDVLNNEGLTTREMSLWIPPVLKRIPYNDVSLLTLKVPQLMFYLIHQAIKNTALVSSVGSFMRCAIIRYLAIVKKIEIK